MPNVPDLIKVDTETVKPTDDMIKHKADMDRADHDKERAEIQYNAACERAEKGHGHD